VIEACLAGGTHYADLTGEMPFVRSIIDAFDDRAAQAGIKIVQPCGFESLPPDLAVRLAAEVARERWDEDLDEVDLVVGIKPPPGMPRASDGMSGGTFQSVFAVAGSEDPSAVIDPAALIADPVLAAEVRRRSPITLAPRRGVDGAVIAPMVPAAYINPAVIHRAAALAAAGNGRATPPFRYREGVALRGTPASLPVRLALAGAMSGTQATLRSVLRARPATRARVVKAMRPLIPRSGFGPKRDRLEGWHWHLSVSARTTGGHEVGVEADADGHPGYLATARMMGEAGVLLARDGATPERGGCLTPATALGTAAVPQLERARMHFAVSA
jgi:short subunit dehydrogenase-like uncharacterized protein